MEQAEEAASDTAEDQTPPHKLRRKEAESIHDQEDQEGQADKQKKEIEKREQGE